jgi:mono/diheme cytochrome c family protein
LQRLSHADNWLAPPLTQANPSPVPWSQNELFAFLRSGVSRFHGTVLGPMSPVVHNGLARLPDADIQALAVYFVDIGGGAARGAEVQPAMQRALAANRIGSGQQYDPAIRLYTAACASCHYNGGDSPNPLRPDLALISAVSLSDPTNLIQVILYGVSAQEGAPGVVMPGFAHGFSDADIARIAPYLRATRTDHGPWPDLEKKVGAIRAQGSRSE